MILAGGKSNHRIGENVTFNNNGDSQCPEAHFPLLVTSPVRLLIVQSVLPLQGTIALERQSEKDTLSHSGSAQSVHSALQLPLCGR